MSASHRDVATTAEAIGRYLQTHPNACDTVEGILKWWLAPREFSLPAEHVIDALEHLIAQGIVTRRTLPDGTVIYLTGDRRPRGGGNGG